MARTRFAWVKFAAIYAGFLALHFSYKTFPGTLFQLLAEKDETTFFHMKMLFVAYVAVALVDLAWRRIRRGQRRGSIYSRALIAVAFPWLTITMWFAAESLGVAMPNLTVELVYASVVTALGIYLALRMEEALDGLTYRPSTKAMIVLVFACAVLSYAAFSFKTPIPFFVTPSGF
jgi:hypothetical protein